MEHHRDSSVEVNFLQIRELFYNCRKNFNLEHGITVQMDNELCSMNTCDVCQNYKFSADLENGPLIDLKVVRKLKTKINEKKIIISII